MSRSTSYLRFAVLLPLLKLLFASLVNALPPQIRDATRIKSRGFEGMHGVDRMVLVEDDDPEGWFYLIMAMMLVLLGGIFAGLTIALMGQDEIYLQVLASSGEASERKNAAKVLRLLKRGKHWVLVSLLLSNVITNETLPIMLDRSLGGGWQAVLGSTILIVIFGEVVPQSICVRYGLPIGAFMSSSTLLLMWILAPVAWPTAKLLDYLLGEDHGTTYKKAGLKTLVTLHRTLGTSPDERLNHDEVTIISAVLDLKAKPVGSIMTPMEDVFTLSADTVLDDDMMNTILSEGYSRIPIYAVNDHENFIGMLLVKMLITYDPEDCSQVQDFHLATLPETRPETSCLDIINFFQEGKSHMILVSESPGEATGALGVCTLEDVIEELIGEEIVDESDVFVDVHKAIRRMNPVPYYRIPKQALNHIDEHAKLDESEAITKTVSHSMERKLSAMSDTIRGPTAKLIRRRNSGGTEPLAIQRKSDELRAHLKHLGPSNLASKPKTTRINAVKIKPGHPTPLSPLASPLAANLERSKSSNIVSSSSVYNNENAQPGVRDENTSLLAAGFEASDAVRAIGYGTLSSSPGTKAKPDVEESTQQNLSRAALIQQTASITPLISNKSEVDIPAEIPSKPPAEESSPPPTRQSTRDSAASKEVESTGSRTNSFAQNNFVHSLSQGSNKATSTTLLPAKLVVNPEQNAAPSDDEAANPDENSSGSTMKSTPSFTLSHRNTARSGSVQERQIDLGGVRKMVLDVHDEEHDPSQSRHNSQSSHRIHKHSRTSDGYGRSGDVAEASESAPLLSESAILSEGAAEGTKDKKKRKKKRSKKKKAGKDGVTSPNEDGGVGV